MEADGLSISDVSLVGIEVKDWGSSLQLSGCSMHAFSDCFHLGDVQTSGLGGQRVRGVHVHSNSTATLSSISSFGMHWGARATLSHCAISDALWDGIVVTQGAAATISHCTVSGSDSRRGLFADGEDSRADVCDLLLLCNGNNVYESLLVATLRHAGYTA